MEYLELIGAGEAVDYYSERRDDAKPMLGEVLFPDKLSPDRNLKYIKGAAGIPATLKPATFDADAPLRGRGGFVIEAHSMPLFREAMIVSETDIQMLHTLSLSNSTKALSPALENIFNDAKTLLDGANIRAEEMRMQLISTGRIVVDDNGVNKEYNYNHPEDQRIELKGEEAWNKGGASPITQLNEWADLVEERTGVRPSRAVMTASTFRLISKSPAVKALKYPTLTEKQLSGITLSRSEVRELIEEHAEITIATYDKKYVDGKGVSHNLFPAGVISLLPEGPIGYTHYGPTTEELQAGTNPVKETVIAAPRYAVVSSDASVGKSITTKQITVAGTFLPSGEALNSVFIAKVVDETPETRKIEPKKATTKTEVKEEADKKEDK